MPPRKRQSVADVPVVPLIDPEQEVYMLPETDEGGDKIHSILESMGGRKKDELVLYLYRAHEKNPTRPHAFLKTYPPEGLDREMILQDIQESYGGGNYILQTMDRATNKVEMRICVTIEETRGAKRGQPDTVVPTVDHSMNRLSSMIEKRVVLDKLESMAEGKGGETAMLAVVLKGMMENNALLLQMVMDRPRESTPARSGTLSELMEAVKLGKMLSEGKLPDEGTLTDKLIEALPAFLDALAQRGQARGVMPAPAAPLHVHPGPQLPPGATPPPPPPAPSPAHIGMERIMNEINFCLNQVENGKLYDHLINYIENYMPGSIDEVLGQTEDAFLAFVYSLNPEYKAREPFFRNLYKYVHTNFSEPEPDGPPAPQKPEGGEK